MQMHALNTTEKTKYSTKEEYKRKTKETGSPTAFILFAHQKINKIRTRDHLINKQTPKLE